MPLLNTADKIYAGTVEADAVYLGATLVWPPAPTGAWGPDESLYPATAATVGDAPPLLSLGSRVGILSDGRITDIRYWRASTMLPSRTVAIWSDAGALLFSAVSTGVTGWNLEPVDPPLLVSAGDIIRVAYGYAGSGTDGSFGFTNSPVYADTANLDFLSGCYVAGSSTGFPDTIPTDSNYYADVVYQEALEGGGEVPWTPDALSNLEAWFDATQDGFADGASIASYTEHSDHARTFTALTGQEPVFRASVSGKPRLEFSGSVKGLTLNPFSASSLGLTYVVCDQTIVTTYIGMLLTYNGTSASYELRYSDYSLTPMLVANYAANGGAAVLVGTADPVTTDVVHMAQFLPAGTTSLWRDGNLLASGTTPAAMATTAADLNLGKRSDAAHYLSHYINEALVINGPINVATRQRIEGYLAHKWGTALPVGHPYEDAPPPAYAGPSASLLVSYTPGTDRNDFTGEVGVRLGIGGGAITVSWIGVRTHAGATGTRTVNLYEWFSGALQRTATVDLTGHATDEYVWGAIEPITLTAGGYYALLMETVASGPIWSNPGAVVFMGMANVYDCYRTGGALYTGGINAQFIGLDLGWS